MFLGPLEAQLSCLFSPTNILISFKSRSYQWFFSAHSCFLTCCRCFPGWGWKECGGLGDWSWSVNFSSASCMLCALGQVLALSGHSLGTLPAQSGGLN